MCISEVKPCIVYKNTKFESSAKTHFLVTIQGFTSYYPPTGNWRFCTPRAFRLCFLFLHVRIPLLSLGPTDDPGRFSGGVLARFCLPYGRQMAGKLTVGENLAYIPPSMAEAGFSLFFLCFFFSSGLACVGEVNSCRIFPSCSWALG